MLRWEVHLAEICFVWPLVTAPSPGSEAGLGVGCLLTRGTLALPCPTRYMCHPCSVYPFLNPTLSQEGTMPTLGPWFPLH